MRPARLPFLLVAALAFLLGAAAPSGPALAADEVPAEWPGFRGPQRDGSVPGVSLFSEGEAGLSLGWKVPLGYGYSALAVAGGRLVTLYSDGERDLAVAFDTETGKELWRHDMGETYKGHDGSHDGPIATPLIEGGRVYGFGPRGQVFALDLATGAEVWSRQAGDDLAGKEPFYGYSSSPMMVEGTLVLAVGGEEGQAVVGLDPDTGETRWSAGDDAINYQSPVAMKLGKRVQVVVAGDTKLFGIDPESGELLWEYEHQGDKRATGSASINPVPAGEGRLLLTYKSDAAAMVRLDPGRGGKVKVEELWSAPTFKSTYVTPVYHEGYLYGVNGRILTCLDAATGDTVWRSREPGDGFLTLVGDHLVIQTKAGSVHVAEASPEGYREVASLPLFEDVSWSEVAFAGGTLYARGMDGLARINLGAQVAADEEEEGMVTGPLLTAFLEKVAAADDKAAVVDAWLAEQASFPVMEAPDLVHFVYRGEAEDIGMEGDLHGARREEPLTRVPGTDLFYLTARLEPDARLTYRFIKDFEERLLDPRNPRTEPDARSGEDEVSWFAMPAWRQPLRLAVAAGGSGRSESHTLQAPLPRPEGEEGPEDDGDAPEEDSEAPEEGSEAPADEPEPLDLTLSIYLPAAYDADPDARFPVIYFTGDAEDRDRLGLAEAMEAMAGRVMEPAILVGVAADDEVMGRLVWGDLQEPFAGMMADLVVPFVDGTYRTRADIWSRAQIGAGFAAYPALRTTLARPGVFGAVAIHSAPLFGDSYGDVLDLMPGPGEKPLRLYQAWGTYDLRSPHEAWDMAQVNRDFRRALRDRGYRPAGGERSCGHNLGCWRDQLAESLPVLFPLPATGD